jgi:LPS export ABC transporter protein LptC
MRLRILLLLIPFFLALATPLWWSAAAGFLRPRGESAADPVRSGEARQFAMEGVRFSQSRDGRPEWRIDAARLMTADRRGNELHLEKVEADLQRQGTSRIHITSDQGIYDSDASILTLIDDVLVRMRNGYELHTDLLRYLDKKGEVETGAPVRLVGKNMILRGRGMKYNLNTGSYAVGGRLDVLLK